MARINVLGTHLDGNDEVTIRKNYHASWRTTNRKGGVPFFALYEGFKDKELLATLDGGALRLYLYFGFAAHNQHGDSWYSVESIAKYFKKQTRTIDSWIRELVDAGLIYRARDHRKSNSTFLIPYSDTLLLHRGAASDVENAQSLLDNAITDIGLLTDVYGPVQSVFHVFQWGTAKGRRPSKDATGINLLFIITKRSPHDVLTGHICELQDFAEGYGISQLQVDDVATFQSPFLFHEQPVLGIAVRHNYRLKLEDNQETLLNLLQDLSRATPESIIRKHPRVEYGLIEDVLELDEVEDESAATDEEA